MKKPQLLLVVFLGMLACSPRNDESLQKEELLKVTKEQKLFLQQNIDEAHAVLDTISLLAKIDHDKNARLADRLKAVHEHMMAVEEKLKKTEGELRTTRVRADAYMMMADAYKGEVDILNQELELLADSITQFRATYAGEPMAKRN